MATDPECPLTMQSEKNHIPSVGHQRAKKTNFKGHKKANVTNSKLSSKPNCIGQHTLVDRPTLMEPTEEPQEHTHHEEILSVQTDNTQKSTYNAKVSNTEATALFDSGTTFSCISK